MDEKTRLKLDKNFKRIRSLERRFPLVRKITQYPKIGPWVPVAIATAEVAGSLLLAGLFAWTFAIAWSYIPWPNINIPWPGIDLPDIPFPHISLPNLPDIPGLPVWAKDILFWVSKTWPIWIAVAFAVYEMKKRKGGE